VWSKVCLKILKSFESKFEKEIKEKELKKTKTVPHPFPLSSPACLFLFFTARPNQAPARKQCGPPNSASPLTSLSHTRR
jgi:hypothetical protein